MPDRLAEILGTLVRTRSQNPLDGEAAMAGAVVELLAPTGAEVELVELAPGRPSVGARIAGAAAGPTLVLNGHVDTVPAGDGWTVDPFAGEIRDGRLYGRGACDMKAGLAVQIAVAHAVARRRDELRGALVLHFAAGEETAEPGTRSLLEAGFVGDVGITTEPTALRVAVAQRGAAYYRLRIAGRMAHAGRAELADNPTDRIPAVLARLDGYRREIAERGHPVLGAGSCTVTMVHAGEQANVVPASCELVLDRRLVPGEDGEQELGRLRAALAGLPVAVELLERGFAPSETRPDSPFAALVREHAAAVTGEDRPFWGTPYASDVRNLINDAGIDAVTFGPGEIDLAHAVDEHVELDELAAAAQVIERVADSVLFA